MDIVEPQTPLVARDLVGPPWRTVAVPPKGKHRLTTGLGNSTPRDVT